MSSHGTARARSVARHPVRKVDDELCMDFSRYRVEIDGRVEDD